MKKTLLILLIIISYSYDSSAKVQMGVGVTVGPAFGRWNNKFLAGKLASAGGNLGYQIGLHAGLQGRVWFNKFVGLGVAAEFNMAGSNYSKYSGSGGTTIEKYTHKENQITLPLTVMVGYGNDRLRFYANLGGYFGYAISGQDLKDVNVNGSAEPRTTEKSDYKNVYSPLDLGVRGGLGFQIYVDKKAKHSLTFDLNYDMGLFKVFKNNAVPGYYNNASKLSLTPSRLTIGVGYVFNLGKSQLSEQSKKLRNQILLEDEENQ